MISELLTIGRVPGQPLTERALIVVALRRLWKQHDATSGHRRTRRYGIARLFAEGVAYLMGLDIDELRKYKGGPRSRFRWSVGQVLREFGFSFPIIDGALACSIGTIHHGLDELKSLHPIHYNHAMRITQQIKGDLDARHREPNGENRQADPAGELPGAT